MNQLVIIRCWLLLRLKINKISNQFQIILSDCRQILALRVIPSKGPIFCNNEHGFHADGEHCSVTNGSFQTK